MEDGLLHRHHNPGKVTMILIFRDGYDNVHGLPRSNVKKARIIQRDGNDEYWWTDIKHHSSFSTTQEKKRM